MNKVVESLGGSASRRLLLRFSSSGSQSSLNGAIEDHLRPEVVLSRSNRKACVEKLKLYRTPKPEKTNDNVGKAAVLVPLCSYQGELGLLYTLRSTKLNTNRGQVSFPGGMHDQDDKTLEETAFRETWEELRIPKETIDVWTNANPIWRSHVTVHPVLGYVGEIKPEKLQLNTEEVEEAFVLSLRTLCHPSTCHYTQFRDNYTLPLYLAGKHRIWGLTAIITHLVMKALVPNVYKHELAHSRPLIGANRTISTSKDTSIS